MSDEAEAAFYRMIERSPKIARSLESFLAFGWQPQELGQSLRLTFKTMDADFINDVVLAATHMQRLRQQNEGDAE